MVTIKYDECGKDFAIALISNLEKMIDGEIDGINIKNITSAAFCKIVNCEPEDFNGWQEILNITIEHLMCLEVLGMEQLVLI